MPDQHAAAARSTPNAHAPAPPDLPTLRASILARLATAIDHAALRLQAAAAGESVFASDADLKATLALLKLLPDLLPHLASPDDEGEQDDGSIPPGYFDYGPPLIPKCEICGAGPGAHWTADCPESPNPRPKICWD